MRLQTKFLLVLTPLAAAAIAFVGLFARRAVYAVLCEELAELAIAKEDAYSAAHAPGIEAHDEARLLPALSALVRETKASYALVLDDSGLVLAHTNLLEKGKRYEDALTRRALSRDAAGFTETSVKGEPVLDVSLPVWAADQDFLIAKEQAGRRRVGTIRLGLPLAAVRETRSKIVGQIGLILAAAGGFALLAFSLLLKRLLLPIRFLAEAAVSIGRGRRGVQAPELSQDELGSLTRQFNQMSRDLAQTTVSKDYLDGIVNHMLDALIVASPDGAVRMANRAALHILGLSQAQLLARPLDSLFGPQHGADWRALSRTGAVAVNREMTLRGKDGSLIPVLVSASVAERAEGGAEAIVIVARDITERKALEARMSQGEKLSAIGQLAAGVAHEINNPLGVILGFSQSLTRRLKPDDPLELPLRSIERESLRCKELVQSLLTFSRQGNQQEGAFDLAAAIKNALALVETQARVKAVEVASHLACGPLTAQGNANQVQQIVINLCSNALDAMSPRGGLLTVALEKVSRRGRDFGHLKVEDTGTGIPKAIQEKIFVPFFTTKEPGKGTGLGLALVYELVQKHHGEIAFDTKVGEGTTFHVLLPLANSLAA